MKGLELSRAFFEEHGRPMLENQFPELLPSLAAGLFGSGSECFGYDDDISQDHDFEPGFCIFLPGEDRIDRRSEFLLERAYAGLPKTFRGFRRSVILPVGGARHGVMRISDFFLRTVGSPDSALSLPQWLSVPEQALAEATNGLLFFDNPGDVRRIREGLSCFPEDVRLKRLAGQLLLMAQSGPYNYPRCLRHGEAAAAQLAVAEFVKSCLSAVFLLNRRYQPYYKWTFRAMRELSRLRELSAPLEYLLSTGNDRDLAAEKSAMIEDISGRVVAELREQELCRTDGELESSAYAVNARIRDPELRNMHILAAV